MQALTSPSQACKHRGLLVDLSETLPYMESRKTERRWKGAYMQARQTTAWVLMVVFMFLCFFDGVHKDIEEEAFLQCCSDHNITASECTTDNSDTTSQCHEYALIKWTFSFCINQDSAADRAWGWIRLIIALSLFLFLVKLQLHYNMMPAIYVTILAIIAQFVLVLSRGYGTETCGDRNTIWLIWLIVQLVSWLFYEYTWRVLPRLQRRGWLLSRVRFEQATDGAVCIKRVNKHDRHATLKHAGKDDAIHVDLEAVQNSSTTETQLHLQYVGPFLKFVPFARNFALKQLDFQGPLDADGRPHGWCIWKDSHKFGEQMFGYFEHGRPVGPFKSWETGTGSTFVKMRVGMLQNRAETKLNSISCLPRFIDDDYFVTVAAIECSVAGLFYRSYPKVDMIAPTQSCDALLRGIKRHAAADQNTETPANILRAEVGMEWVVRNMLCTNRVEDLGTVRSFMVQREASKKRRPHAAKTSSTDNTTTPQQHHSQVGMAAAANTTTMTQQEGNVNVHHVSNHASNDTTVVAPWQEGNGVAPNAVQHDEKGTVAAAGHDDGGSGMQQQLQRIATLPRQSPLPPAGAVDGSAAAAEALQNGGHVQYAPELQDMTQSKAALIFIHGFNSTLGQSWKILGQLAAMANLPVEIMPFIFSWPCPMLLNFLKSQSMAAQSPRTAEALRAMLHGLKCAGFRRFHIMTHSMGGRVLLFAVSALEQVFGEYSEEKRGNGEAVIETITLMQPEFELMQFVNTNIGARLRQLCGVLTIYGDQKDQALFASEVMNALKRQTRTSRKVLREYFVEKEDLAQYAMPPECCCGLYAMEPSLGRRIYHVKAADEIPMDIDVIDTTFLQANIGAGGHNGFVNRSVIDDLRELWLTCKRAKQRTSRLEQRGPNTFGFLIAPTYFGTTNSV